VLERDVDAEEPIVPRRLLSLRRKRGNSGIVEFGERRMGVDCLLLVIECLSSQLFVLTPFKNCFVLG